MKQLLLLLLFHAFAYTQEVTPLLSTDYLALISKDSLRLKNFWPDTINSIQLSPLMMHRDYYGFRVGKISIHNGMLNIEPYNEKALQLGGQFSTRVEIKRINQLPALQTQYVQGRSQNGALAWRGAETGDMFSYGPAINSLEYDGSNYAYDAQGKLVPVGTGNGTAANVYNNNIFRTASLLSQALRIQGRYMAGGEPLVNGTIKLGQSRENTFIKYNKNTSRNISTSLETTIKKLSITGGYTFLQDEFSNPNRNGFLNRVYQDAILSPISFDNAQNTRIAGMQPAYGAEADNPMYLLTDNGNRFLQTHRTGSLMVEYKQKSFRYKITQSIEKLYQNNREGYKPGSAFFPNGIAIDRTKKNVNYLLEGNASYYVKFNDYHFSGKVSAHYSYTNNRSAIDYSPNAAYRYQRSAHDASLTWFAKYERSYTEVGLYLTNKLYASNTATVNNYFLPNISAFVFDDDFLNLENISARLSVAYNRFNNELAVGRSFSQNSLLQYSTQQAFGFFPVTEVNSFDNLEPVRHSEWTSRIELKYKYRVTLYGELFSRKTGNDVFPVFENGNLVLKNIADHRNNGLELGLTLNQGKMDFYTENSLSFFANNIKVTDVKDGYDFTPLAGFSNVHTAIVKGAALGSITGTSYQRDANNNVLIGSDGFPLANATPKVIGNPIPDFIVKLNNAVDGEIFTWTSIGNGKRVGRCGTVRRQYWIIMDGQLLQQRTEILRVLYLPVCCRINSPITSPYLFMMLRCLWSTIAGRGMDIVVLEKNTFSGLMYCD
ncbi:hypothetical protein FAM09_22485 [Niastella caeni]|uniref:TonB-dependent receptor n=1 Tax=Niastella caeni TaxID=2569763 RepID=A0A4S8HHT2_9BACT|nr:hypothetical protein [Niastella caeni]THU34768.1 hypothetical protein FAM09_22485 [Niastella caeni]